MGFFDDFFKGAEASISTIGKSLEQGVQQVGKNIEKNVSSTFNDFAYAISTGDFSNLDQTLVSGMGLMLNPSSTQYKETPVQRATRQAQEKATLEQLAADKAKEDARLKGLADMLSASATARRLAPGISQTLVGGAGSGGLLTGTSGSNLLLTTG